MSAVLDGFELRRPGPTSEGRELNVWTVHRAIAVVLIVIAATIPLALNVTYTLCGLPSLVSSDLDQAWQELSGARPMVNGLLILSAVMSAILVVVASVRVVAADVRQPAPGRLPWRTATWATAVYLLVYWSSLPAGALLSISVGKRVLLYDDPAVGGMLLPWDISRATLAWIAFAFLVVAAVARRVCPTRHASRAAT